MRDQNVYSYAQSEDTGLKSFINGMYSWMAIGLAITGIVALYTYRSEPLMRAIVSNRVLFFGLIIGEIALVFIISSRIMTMETSTGSMLFILYSAINGLTLSIIFLVYTMQSIANVFFITAGIFAVMSFYGFVTKKDLSSWGNVLFMGLIGIIIASLVNLFLKSTMLYWLITYVGVAVFVGLTAYDTQRMKKLYLSGQFSGDGVSKLAILGALKLYLDFINLFLMLLRILGRRK